MDEKLQLLRERLVDINDLESAIDLMMWDQSTYMPPGSARSRARQMATISRIAHEKFTDPAVGRLLEDLQDYEDSLPYDSDEASLIRVTRRDYEKAIAVPAALLMRLNEQTVLSYQAWTEARQYADFAVVLPHLEQMLDISREYANCFPGYEHIADPLIGEVDEGLTVAAVKSIFSALRSELIPLVDNILAKDSVDDTCLKRFFAEQKQLNFGRTCINDFGFDFERGRQDITYHPFMIRFSSADVRITTRVNENFLNDSLFNTLHEAGHALYEQGIDISLDGTPLAAGSSASVHESQSRLWENQIGRSRQFWSHYYPLLQRKFPDQLGTVHMDAFYRAINKVQRSLIRTDADEITYNLHVMIRFDLEHALLEGKLAVKDLPAAWHARYESDLGLQVPNDNYGVLQDVQWFSWQIGGLFQGYTLGNIMSAAFFDAAIKAHPEIPQQTAKGEFGALLGWLRQHIYQHGRKFTTNELVQRVTGGPISIDPYTRYLKAKYGELYAL